MPERLRLLFQIVLEVMTGCHQIFSHYDFKFYHFFEDDEYEFLDSNNGHLLEYIKFEKVRKKALKVAHEEKKSSIDGKKMKPFKRNILICKKSST